MLGLIFSPLTETTMPNFFYLDQNNQKQGPLNAQQIKTLAAQGVINPNTPLETDGGHKGLAGQIPGLFAAPPSPFQPSQPIPVPSHASKHLFCTNCGNPVSEQAVACMSCGAKPTGHKKFCRHCGVALNPAQVVCIKCGASLTGNSGVGTSGTLHAINTIKTLNSYFKRFWIGVGGGCTLFVVSMMIIMVIDAAAEAIPDENIDMVTGSIMLIISGLIAFISGISAIGSGIFGLMLLYRLWKLIPTDIARTSPGKAIGFLFIPFFAVYWGFISYWGLAKDMNKTLRQRGVHCQVNEGLGLTFCILVVLSIIPYLGMLFILAATIVLIFFLKSVKDGAIALLEQQVG